MQGIIYLVQPAQLLNTNRYKIGMSNKNNLDRVKKAYLTGTKWISINEVNNPSNVEKNIIQIFKEKFTLCAGREYFEGDIKDILQEYIEILLKHMLDKSSISDTKIINKNANIINKNTNIINKNVKIININANIIQKWWVKLMLKYYDIIDEDYFEDGRDKQYMKYKKYLLMYEYDEVIDTYEKYIKYAYNNIIDNIIIDDIIIINKVNKVGFIKFSDKNYYYVFGDNIDEDLYSWINAYKYDSFHENNGKNTVIKKCKFCIDKLIEDIVKKCYKKNIIFYKHKKYEYIVNDPECVGKLCIYNSNTKKLLNINLKTNEILIEYQIISPSIISDEYIDINYYNKLLDKIDKKLYHIHKYKNLNFS